MQCTLRLPRWPWHCDKLTQSRQKSSFVTISTALHTNATSTPASSPVTAVSAYYRRTPVALGVLVHPNHFETIISAQSCLPTCKRVRFESALDYIQEGIFEIAQKSSSGTVTVLEKVRLQQVPQEREGGIKVDITVRLQSSGEGEVHTKILNTKASRLDTFVILGDVD